MKEFVKNIVDNYPWLVWVFFALGIILLFGYLVENYWKEKVTEILNSSKKVNPTMNTPEEKPVEINNPEAQAAPVGAGAQPQGNLAQMVQQQGVAEAPQAVEQAPVAQEVPVAQQVMETQPVEQQVVDQQVYQQDANGQVIDPNAQVQIPQEVYQDAMQNIDPSIMQVDNSIDVSSLPVYNPTDQN